MAYTRQVILHIGAVMKWPEPSKITRVSNSWQFSVKNQIICAYVTAVLTLTAI